MILSIALALSASVAPVSAQAMTQHYQLHIPRQPLDGALKEFAHQTGLQVARFSDTIDGSAVVGPVAGDLSAQQALGFLLTSSGLTYKMVNDRTIVVIKTTDTAGSETTNSFGEDRAESGAVGKAPSVGRLKSLSPAGRLRLAQADQRASSDGSPATSNENEQASQNAAVQLEEISVTARRRVERAQDVPVALTAVSGATFARGEHLRLEDLNVMAPSVNISIPTPRQTSFSIRGLGANPANDGLEQSTGLFIDGVYLAKSGMAVIDMVDVERIEVLRGPQGTLFGKNTTAGAISIYSKEPQFSPESTVRVSAGDYGYTQVQASTTGPLADTVAASVMLYRTSRDGWVRDTTRNEDVNGVGRQGGRAQLLWKPTDDFRLRLIAELHKEDDSSYATIIENLGATPGTFQAGLKATGASIVVSPNGDAEANDGPTIVQSTQKAATALADWSFGDLTLTSVSGYRMWRYYTFSDIDGSSAPLFGATTNLDYHQISEEVRLASSSAERLKWTVGAYYFNQDTNYVSQLFYEGLAASQLSKLTPAQLGALAPTTPALAGLLAYNNTRWDTAASPRTRSYALFGQATWAATAQLNITAGARASYENKEESVSRAVPVSTTSGEPVAALGYTAYPATHVERNDWSPSALLTADYKPFTDLMLYATISHGEKAGGLNAALPPTGLTPAALQVKPETATNYEIGLKSDLLEKRLRVNLTAFWTEVRDYQASYNGIYGTGSAPVSLLTNVGAVRTRGAELEVIAKPIRNLSIGLNGSFDEAIYTSYPNAPCPAETTGKTSCNLTGQQLVDAPKWIANANALYDTAISDSLRGYASGELSWRSRYNGSLDASRFANTGDYALVNLRAGLKAASDRWDVSLWVKNAADRRYVSNFSNAGALVPGIYFPYFGEPRTYGLTVQTTW
jgi:iron complex outermembrane receptor protein